MTDKQIKLDGSFIPIELAKRAGLINERPDWRITLQADHIKRLEEELQAKEQECKELNTTITNLENIRDEFSTKLDQLKAENIKFTLDSKKLVAQYSAKLKRLRQTLTEIKEIAEKQCVCGVDCIDMKQILQKISECETR